MRTPRLLLSSLIALGALLATERHAHADIFKGGVGVIGAFGGNFLDKPGEKRLPDGNGGRTAGEVSYPGFGGVTGGFGLAFDARFLGLVGVEVDVIRMTNKGHANPDISGQSYEINISHDAWHIPVLLKGSLPLPLISPYAVVGVEFVQTSNAKADISKPFYTVDARTDNYRFFTAGLGLEIKLPIPSVDVRIPFSLRGSYYNPGDNVEDRADYSLNGNTITKVTYNTQWKWQALATLGAQIYF